MVGNGQGTRLSVSCGLPLHPSCRGNEMRPVVLQCSDFISPQGQIKYPLQRNIKEKHIVNNNKIQI